MYNSDMKGKGFTLIEIMVAVSIFVIVMVISIGSVLSAVDADNKAEALSSVINNVNSSVESIVRDIRTGTNYSINGMTSGSGNSITFTDSNGNVLTYALTTQGSVQSISRSILSLKQGTPFVPVAGNITGPEVNISNFNIILTGGGTKDGQPAILLQIRGSAGSGKTLSKFNIETMITQRVLDTD